VAVTILPELVARNLDRLERFAREAKAAAEPSQPNILDHEEKDENEQSLGARRHGAG
jgi:hypothetical protein